MAQLRVSALTWASHGSWCEESEEVRAGQLSCERGGPQQSEAVRSYVLRVYTVPQLKVFRGRTELCKEVTLKAYASCALP